MAQSIQIMLVEAIGLISVIFDLTAKPNIYIIITTNIHYRDLLIFVGIGFGVGIGF